MSLKSPSLLAQNMLHTTRTKLTRESSAGDPRLFKLLVCANLADALAAKSKTDSDAKHNVAHKRSGYGWQAISNGSESSSSTRDPAPSSQSGNSELVRTPNPHATTSQRTVARPQASLYDRAAFRRSLNPERKHCDDSAIKSDSDSTYSEDDDNDEERDDGEGDDDTERHLPRVFARSAQRASDVAVS
jgi:hypothetical protein